MSTLVSDAKLATGAAKSAADFGVELSKKNRELEAAQRIENPEERAKKTKEIEASIRDLQSNTVKSIGDQLLKGEDKKRFDMMIEAGKLIRERALSDKDLFPDWEELTHDPTDQGRTPLQMLGSNFSQLEALAKAAGYEKEFKALNAGLQVADIFDRYGLGDGKFADIFGTEKQLKDLQALVDKGELSSLLLGQAGITLDNIQSGLGMLSALGGYFGFGEGIAKVQKVVSALKGLQQAFTGDITGGIDAILALDGLLFNLPPEAKEALNQAKKLAKELKKMGPMKPISGPPGVFVEGKHIAALGLSGTIHGMPLAPGPGSPNVFSYNMPIWRTVSDKHVCMLPGPGPAPHMPPPGGVVPKGATKTYANKLLIARHDDSTIEANGGGMVKIIPLPEAIAIALKRAAEEAERKRKEQEKKKAEKAAKAKKDEENRMKRDKHRALRERQDKFEKIAKDRENHRLARHLPEAKIGEPSKLERGLSLAADFTPGVSSIKSAFEVVTGYDPITGEPISRVVSAVGLIPDGKVFVKGGKLLKVASHGDEAVDAAKGMSHIVPRGSKHFPGEAEETLKRIKNNEPHSYPGKDGSYFENRVNKKTGSKPLPEKEADYYKEYTVDTPGAKGRGKRRIVTGKNGEVYYTDDHYDTFERIE